MPSPPIVGVKGTRDKRIRVAFVTIDVVDEGLVAFAVSRAKLAFHIRLHLEELHLHRPR